MSNHRLVSRRSPGIPPPPGASWSLLKSISQLAVQARWPINHWPIALFRTTKKGSLEPVPTSYWTCVVWSLSGNQCSDRVPGNVHPGLHHRTVLVSLLQAHRSGSQTGRRIVRKASVFIDPNTLSTEGGTGRTSIRPTAAALSFRPCCLCDTSRDGKGDLGIGQFPFCVLFFMERRGTTVTASESCLEQGRAKTWPAEVYSNLLAKVGSGYCRFFHKSISLPLKGKYHCWKCLREFEIEW